MKYKQPPEETKTKIHQQYFEIWKEWATGLFLFSWANACSTLSIIKIQTCYIFPTIEPSLCLIQFFHKSLLSFDPCSKFFIINMFEAAKRVTAHKIKKKKALYLHNLNKISVKLNQNKTNLAYQGLITIILIAFCGFMKFRLSRSNFIFSSTCVKVFIEKSKKDIYWEGMWVYISDSSKNFSIKTT